MRLKDAKIGFLGDNIRVFQTLSLEACVPGVALTLNPRLQALGLSPSAFNLSGWIPTRHKIASNNRITAKVMPTNRGKAAKLTV